MKNGMTITARLLAAIGALIAILAIMVASIKQDDEDNGLRGKIQSGRAGYSIGTAVIRIFVKS
jgi:hypothetical protein